MRKKKSSPPPRSSRTLLDDDYSQHWPPQDKFPINNDTFQRTVKEEILKDIIVSENYLVITGFTSLANIIEIFGSDPHEKLSSLKIVLGFEPEPRRRKRWPIHSLPTEIKNYWLKENFSIMLGGPIINIIEQINRGKIEFRSYDKLHAKIYIGDKHAILGSANFSKLGITKQQEANIKVSKDDVSETEKQQYLDIETLAKNFYELSEPYNEEAIALFKALLSEVTWQEALARAIAEVLEGEWLKEYPHLYQAIINTDLWPSQRMGVSEAMYVLQNQQNVLIADPTGSGKTKFSTTLALTLFHWFWENGRKDKSNPLIICPPQVVDNWKREQKNIKFFNEICSMGILSVGSDKKRKELVEFIEKASILIVDEAHNYLNKKSKRSDALASHVADHVILSTATPINKRSDDLLRLIELLDVDNLGDQELKDFKLLRNPKNRRRDASHLEKLREYIGKFIVRRTKKQLNSLIDQEPDKYLNAEGEQCRFPKTDCNTYETGETEEDIKIANQISELLSSLKGVNYLRKIVYPDFPLDTKEDEMKYINQRIRSAPALAGFLVRSKLRSSHCALLELLEGSEAAQDHFDFKSQKSKTGNIITKIEGFKNSKPKISFDKEIVPEWLTNIEQYAKACEEEIGIYKKIAVLARKFSGKREESKAYLLLKLVKEHKKILAFDSTILTLDYLKKIIHEKQLKDLSVYVVTGQSDKMKEALKEKFGLGSRSDESIIALCSDAMSEGVNLQDAKAVVLLDMPSVLRIIEQRIGRVERMDSGHEQIFAYWPNDTDSFSLKGDRNLINTLMVTENLIGNNVDFPKELYEKYLKNDVSVDNMIAAYKEYKVGDYDWKGIKDSFKPIYELIEGESPLIDKNVYNEIKKVSSAVKSRVSFVRSHAPFSFFAFRGDVTKSPKWFFIDQNGKTETEFPEICERLRQYIVPDNIKPEHWTKENDLFLVEAVKKLRKEELGLLPKKRKRALDVAQALLKKHYEKTNQTERKKLIYDLQGLFETANPGDHGIVDYYHFSQNWLDILQPVVNTKRRGNRKKRYVISLVDLTDKDVPLPNEQLEQLYKNCPYTETIDEKIAACIIGI